MDFTDEFKDYITHLHAKQRRYCKVCKSKNELYHCGSCMHAVYCSEKCQKIDYPMHICGKEDEKAPKRVKTREVYYSDLENIPVDVLELLMSMLDANERLNFRSISPILNQRFGYRWLHWIPVVMSMDDLKALSVNVRKHITILTLIGNDQVDDLKQLGLNRLTHLTFGHEFNQPVDSLPQSLIQIRLLRRQLAVFKGNILEGIVIKYRD